MSSAKCHELANCRSSSAFVSGCHVSLTGTREEGTGEKGNGERAKRKGKRKMKWCIPPSFAPFRLLHLHFTYQINTPHLHSALLNICFSTSNLVVGRSTHLTFIICRQFHIVTFFHNLTHSHLLKSDNPFYLHIPHIFKSSHIGLFLKSSHSHICIVYIICCLSSHLPRFAPTLSPAFTSAYLLTCSHI